MDGAKRLLQSGRFVFFVFFAAYLAVIYPLAYFRHDDWLILGNAVRHLADDWTFAFKPTLFFLQEEVVWFFRPLFKALPLFFFKIIGLNYYLWLTAMFLFTLAAMALMFLTVKKLTTSLFWSSFAVVFFAASFHLHFGSLFWIGEGMMNCPQLFLLSLSSYAFVSSFDCKGSRFFFWQAISWLGFLLAVGFKESSIFQSVFLSLLLLRCPSLSRYSLKFRASVVVPLALFTIYFLYLRLWVMPINPYYVPRFDTKEISREVAMLLLVYLSPVAVWCLAWSLRSKDLALTYLKALSREVLFGAFFILSLLPYLGHSFFSPGWLMVPAYYFFMILAIAGAKIQAPPAWSVLKTSAVAVLLLGLTPVVLKLYQLRWWEWKPSQLYVEEIVKSLPDQSIKEIVVFNCTNPEYPDLNFDRVIGFEAGLYQLWAVHHATPVPVIIRDCQYLKPKHSKWPRRLVLKWEFPSLTWVNEKALLNRLSTQ